MTDPIVRASGADVPADLGALKLPELQQLATELGVVGVSKLRKGELVDAITQTQNAGAPAEPVEAADGDVVADVVADAADAAAETAVTDAPAEPVAEAAAEAPATESPRRRGSRRATTDTLTPAPDAAGEAPAEQAAAQPAEGTEAAAEQSAEGAEPAAEGDEGSASGSRRSRNRNRRGGDRAENGEQRGQNGQGGEPRQQNGQQGQQAQGGQNGQQGNRGPQNERAEIDGEGRNRNRNRGRDRKRGPGGDEIEPEISDDDVLIPIAGILDVLDNYAFVRTTGYLPGPSDVYVSLGQVKKYHLRKGDAVVGAVKAPREGESNSRQKYNALVSVESVNGKSVEESGARAEFIGFTPVAPFERLRLETERNQLDTRLVDLFAPLGKGQRAIISGGAQTGKSTLLHQMAAAVSVNHPDAHLMVVLVDERPEVVTEASRLVKGEVVASTFDRNPEDHITVAELAVERAKRLVELGHDVVVLLDSLSALTRAYQAHAAAGNRMFSNANDPAALFAVKKLLGAARKVENGGSLTLIATASENDVERAALEEFRNAANAEVRLSGALAASRTFPAIDVNGSASRTERDVLSADEVRILGGLRRELSAHAEAAALQSVISGLVESATNVEFLLGVQRKHGA